MVFSKIVDAQGHYFEAFYMEYTTGPKMDDCILAWTEHARERYERRMKLTGGAGQLRRGFVQPIDKTLMLVYWWVELPGA